MAQQNEEKWWTNPNPAPEPTPQQPSVLAAWLTDPRNPYAQQAQRPQPQNIRPVAPQRPTFQQPQQPRPMSAPVPPPAPQYNGRGTYQPLPPPPTDIRNTRQLLSGSGIQPPANPNSFQSTWNFLTTHGPSNTSLTLPNVNLNQAWYDLTQRPVNTWGQDNTRNTRTLLSGGNATLPQNNTPQINYQNYYRMMYGVDPRMEQPNGQVPNGRDWAKYPYKIAATTARMQDVGALGYDQLGPERLPPPPVANQTQSAGGSGYGDYYPSFGGYGGGGGGYGGWGDYTSQARWWLNPTVWRI